jgi:F420-dependent oxidoreductase-like protein
VQIIRKILARDEPVAFAGKQYTVPHTGGTGLGKPLKSILHPLRADLPIYLGAEGPKNVAMTAEIADGWFPIFFSPKSDAFYRRALDDGFARRGAAPDTFEIANAVSVVPIDDVEAAADAMRPTLALYIGGMGARTMNFHYDVFARMGYEGECATIQQHYLEGNKRDAIAAVPTKLVEDVALIGPIGKMKDDLEAWKRTCMTTMLVGGPPQLLETIAKVVL